METNQTIKTKVLKSYITLYDPTQKTFITKEPGSIVNVMTIKPTMMTINRSAIDGKTLHVYFVCHDEKLFTYRVMTDERGGVYRNRGNVTPEMTKTMSEYLNLI